MMVDAAIVGCTSQHNIYMLVLYLKLSILFLNLWPLHCIQVTCLHKGDEFESISEFF